MKDSADLKKIKKNIRLNDIGALVVIGGNGTLSAAHEVLRKRDTGRGHSKDNR